MEITETVRFPWHGHFWMIHCILHNVILVAPLSHIKEATSSWCSLSQNSIVCMQADHSSGLSDLIHAPAVDTISVQCNPPTVIRTGRISKKMYEVFPHKRVWDKLFIYSEEIWSSSKEAGMCFSFSLLNFQGEETNLHHIHFIFTAHLQISNHSVAQMQTPPGHLWPSTDSRWPPAVKYSPNIKTDFVINA